MAHYGYITKKIIQREITERVNPGFQRQCHVTADFVRRIGLEAELEGHSGCVNCLEWNEKGSLLASGSDDVQVNIWDPFTHKAVTTIRTGHHGNIFSVKFLPNSNDALIATGAADCKIRVHDLNVVDTTHVFGCHQGRVKRLATAPNIPFMFWSAAEDGTVMQFDLRCPETASSSNPQNVLINLNAHLGPHAEAKCLAINPLRPEQLAIGANDPYVRIYDRRMLSCRSIQFSSEPGSRSAWERQNVLLTSKDEFSLPVTSAKYYVAGGQVRPLTPTQHYHPNSVCFLLPTRGHLPQKQQDYRKRFRSLASTYLTFSPDGSELLVNLGGEQIYTFDVNRRRTARRFDISMLPYSNGVVKDAAPSNGFRLHSNGVSKHLSSEKSMKKRSGSHNRPLPPAVEAIKQRANSVFEKQKYNQAILLYNQALALVPESPVLYGNRAAAYMKRAWDGDVYAALRDCYSAIQIDNDHIKAHFRLARCLFELSWIKDALDCLQHFKTTFPDYAKSHACETLDRDIRAAMFSNTELSKDGEKEKTSKESKYQPPKESISEQEMGWRQVASDYEARFCGHCNTTTDIKEANFFGSNGQYIVAGSDDGSFFIWERQTANIVRVLRGDDSIVNCLQPHPSQCLLATSGIDPVVRLWSPRPEDGRKDEREVDNSDDAASANQKRMNADPLEVMLMNMGYRITGVLDGDDDDDREGPVQCRPS